MEKIMSEVQAVNEIIHAFGQIFDVEKAPKYTCRICEREFHSEDMTLERDVCQDCDMQCDEQYESRDGFRSRRDPDIIEAVKSLIVRCECGEFLGYDEADRGYVDRDGNHICAKCYEDADHDRFKTLDAMKRIWKFDADMIKNVGK